MRTRGFSLLEIAIVLAIIGTLLAGSIVIGLGGLEASRYNATVRRMDDIHKTILLYSTNFDRLPCPSSLALTSSNANFGIEAANKGTCTGGTPAANFTAASGTVEGGLPTRTLHLPDEYQFDAWGRRFRYAVNPDYTADDSLPVGTGNCTSTKAITVKDAGAGDRSTNAAYALISHGANGHGGYTRNGVVFNAGSTNTDEQTNCHCDTLAAATTYSPTYVQKLPTESSTSASNVFDDIATYREPWQLQTLASPLASTACSDGFLYVLDWGNNRVVKFTSGGAYEMCFGSGCNGASSGAGNATGQLNSPGTIAIDKNGNLYVSNLGNDTIRKFNSAGTEVLRMGTSGWGGCSSVGAIPEFDSGGYAMALAVDPVNASYLLVNSRNNTMVLKVDTSTGLCLESGGRTEGYSDCTLMLDATATYAYGMRGNDYLGMRYPNDQATWYSGQISTSPGGGGSSNGAFGNHSYWCAYNFPAIDPADTSKVWIVDEINSRIQQFNTSDLSYVAQCSGFPNNAGGTGNMSVSGITFDNNSNMYISNEYTNRIYKYKWNGSTCVAQNDFAGNNYFDCSTCPSAFLNAANVTFSNY